MKSIAQINEVYISSKKTMVLIHKGVLSLDSVAAINSFREAAAASKKELKKTKKIKSSDTCKPN